jgi:hypothetical protein
MIVEIDPADVVSVPVDCSCQKLRTTTYKVVHHMETIERPLDEGLNSDYGDYDYGDEPDDNDYNSGWEEGYQAAKREGHQNN